LQSAQERFSVDRAFVAVLPKRRRSARCAAISAASERRRPYRRRSSRAMSPVTFIS